MKLSNLQFESLAVHAGQEPDPTTGAVMVPIYQTSTYRQLAVGETQGYEYSRTGNPTRQALESCLQALEGGERALGFASGMAAIDCVLRLLNPGDHILASNDLYGGTYRLFENVYRSYGITISYAPADDSQEFIRHLQPQTRLVWLETPSNPYLRLCDITAISQGTKSAGGSPWVCVDNTFATPFLQRPLELGADLVVHSTTKYLGGHSDVIGGAVVAGDTQTGSRLAFLQNAIGAVPGPLDCFLVLRGIKTLALRMERHALNAAQIASYLIQHVAVAEVFYPGLASHPGHRLIGRQMKNGGGMVSFSVHGGAAQARRVVEGLKLFTLGESLGGVESLVEIPAVMTHGSTAASSMAVDPRLVRLSVGIESVDDLIKDLSQALDQAR